MSSLGMKSIIGERFEFPISSHESEEGIVEYLNTDTGKVHIRDDAGVLWKGFEYQLSFIE